MPAELGPALAAGKGTGLIQVTARHGTNGRTRFAAALLSGTILAGIAAPAAAQSEAAQPAATAPAANVAMSSKNMIYPRAPLACPMADCIVLTTMKASRR